MGGGPEPYIAECHILLKVNLIFFFQFATIVGDIKTEKQKNLDILEKLSKGKPILDVRKATNAATSEVEKRLSLK